MRVLGIEFTTYEKKTEDSVCKTLKTIANVLKSRKSRMEKEMKIVEECLIPEYAPEEPLADVPTKIIDMISQFTWRLWGWRVMLNWL